jgi:replicative superfamily II helicase
MDTSESRSEIPESFEMLRWRRLEKFSWINHERYEEVLQRVKEERNILQTIRRKANWIGHIVSRNCLLKHIIEGKVREG